MTGPRTGCSIVCIIPRLCRSGSCISSSVVSTAPQGTPDAGDDPGHFLLGALRRPFGNGRIHGLPVLGADAAVGHARIVEQILPANRFHQTAPMVFVAPRGKDVAPVIEPSGRAFVEAARRGPEHRVAATRQLVLAGSLPAHRRAAIVQHRVAHGDLDVLAAAGCWPCAGRARRECPSRKACRCRYRRRSSPAGPAAGRESRLPPLCRPSPGRSCRRQDNSRAARSPARSP